MALRFGIMIEGQEGLGWAGWDRLAQTVEAAGYESLFRSDHLTGLFGAAERASLDCWASLTWLATATRRLRFGALVSPLTFYHPALLAKRAAAVSQLSGGRLDLGIGAGWQPVSPAENRKGCSALLKQAARERLDFLEDARRKLEYKGRRGTPSGPTLKACPFLVIQSEASRGDSSGHGAQRTTRVSGRATGRGRRPGPRPGAAGAGRRSERWAGS